MAKRQSKEKSMSPAAVAKRKERAKRATRALEDDPYIPDVLLIENLLTLLVCWSQADKKLRDSPSVSRDRVAITAASTLRKVATDFFRDSYTLQWDAISVSLFRDLKAIYSATTRGQLKVDEQYSRIEDMLYRHGIIVDVLPLHIETFPPRSIRFADVLALRRSKVQIRREGDSRQAAAKALEKISGISASMLINNARKKWPDVKRVTDPVHYFGAHVNRSAH